jgi:LCP family protein required for cell wall assembly
MRTALDYLIYVCAFCIIGAGAVGAWDAVTVPGQVATSTSGETAGAFDILPTPFPGRSLVTILIVGADDRDGEAGRSDSMILLFLNPRTNQVALLSAPRDLLVSIPGHGRQKICHSYAEGGVDLTRETIEEVFDGVNIDFYAKADFKGFIEIVDMLGGVDIEVPDVEGRGRGMNWDDDVGELHIHLKPGFQHLDGEQAIGFVRYRKSNTPGLGDGDFARSERQQEFLKALVEQKLKIRNALNLAKVAGKIMKWVETDLTVREGGELALALRSVKPENLLQASLQPYLRDARHGGLSVVLCSERSIRRVLGEVDTHLRSLPGVSAEVVVLNGGGQAGAAAAAGVKLSRQGFEPEDTGNADSFDYEQTVIRHPHDQQAAARAIKRALGVGRLVEINEDDDVSPEDAKRITVIIGTDFDFQTDDSAD